MHLHLLPTLLALSALPLPSLNHPHPQPQPSLTPRNGYYQGLTADLTLKAYTDKKGCKGGGTSYAMTYGSNVTQNALSYSLDRDLRAAEALDWYGYGSGGKMYSMVGENKKKGCHDLPVKMGMFDLWLYYL
ncbi:hypothetical protein ACLMJK_000365 [Lecanora helva]